MVVDRTHAHDQETAHAPETTVLAIETGVVE